MKTRAIFFAAFLPLAGCLFGCGNSTSTPTAVPLLFGSKEYVDEEISPTSHMKKLADESALQNLISQKSNFLLIVLGDEHTTCGCWNTFHQNNIVRYQKATNALFYYLYSSQLEDAGNKYGLDVGSQKATLAIYQDGKLAYQNWDTPEDADFYKDYSAFHTWMNERVTLPRVYFIDREQLSALYDDTQEFTIYFSRQTCSDCAYMQSNEYRSWYFSHSTGVEDSYVIDMDSVGIGAIEVEGKIYYRSTASDANEYQKAAQAQYDAFKVEYGLAYSEENPVGYGDGAVPTIYHINPEGNGKKSGDVIDMAGVFFNETVENGKIVSSFFDEDHLSLEALSYLSSSSLDTKNLIGKTVARDDQHAGLSAYENPILDLLLTHAVGTL